MIDSATLEAIIKVQALIRGFLTRKIIFEHLQQMVAQNEAQEEYDQENEGADEYGYECPEAVQEVNTCDEESQDEDEYN